MTRVSVSVDDEHLGTIQEVAETLRRTGMQVDQVLEDIGLITGSVPSESRPDIQAVEGVASVDDEQSFQLPPPESEIQ